MEHEEQARSERESGSEDMPHGHEGSEREGGQVGAGAGGLGGDTPGGTQSDQGRGYGAEGGPARQEFSGEQEMPHGHEGSDRAGPQVGVGVGGLGGREWPGRREEASGQGDSEEEQDTDEQLK